jgi:hypothetical protein
MAEEPKQVIVEREREPRSSVGTIVAVVVGVIIVILLLMYGLPYLTGGNNSTTNVNVPAPTGGTTE